MAKRKLSARLRHLMQDNISDRDLADVFTAAVLAKDLPTALKAQENAANRSDWGIMDSRKFRIAPEVHQAMGELQGGRESPHSTESDTSKRAWKLFDVKLKAVRALYDAIANGAPSDWMEIERVTDAAYQAAPNRKAQMEVTDFDFTAAESMGAPSRSRGAPQSIDRGNNETLSRGVFPQKDGSWLALTLTKSKTFATESGARNWYERNAGSRLESNPNRQSELAQLAAVLGPRTRR